MVEIKDLNDAIKILESENVKPNAVWCPIDSDFESRLISMMEAQYRYDKLSWYQKLFKRYAVMFETDIFYKLLWLLVIDLLVVVIILTF